MRPSVTREPLTPEYIADCRKRAYKYGTGTWTGMAGGLSADVIRLCYEIDRLKCELARRQEREPYWLRPHD
jgi:hypothetical protein